MEKRMAGFRSLARASWSLPGRREENRRGTERIDRGRIVGGRRRSWKLLYTTVLTQYRLLGGITWPMAESVTLYPGGGVF